MTAARPSRSIVLIEGSNMSRRAFAAMMFVTALAAGCASPGTLAQDARGLESANADVRRESALELGRTRVADAALRERLVRRLSVMAQSDADGLVRSAALWALVMQQPEAGVEVATRLRADVDPMVRCDAVKVMARGGGAATVGALIEVARKDPDERVRREAVRALGSRDEPRVIAVLIEKLADESPPVSHAARESLVNISAGVDFGTNAEAWKKWLE